VFLAFEHVSEFGGEFMGVLRGRWGWLEGGAGGLEGTA
jgi:hypothetical protein